MKKISVLKILLISFLVFANCAKKNNKIKQPEKLPSVDILYKKAFELLENGEAKRSIDLFQKVETRYSFSEYAPKSTLMIIYINYELNEPVSTLEYANKYKKIYPKSEYIDYVDYIIALTFYEQINVISKDQTYTREALKRFKYILQKYPNSPYALDSKLKIDLVNEQLAGNQLYIAKFYMDKSKWIAALKRLKIIIEKYDTTIYSEEALHRIVEVYYRLGNINLAKKYAAILGYNFNDGDWYKKTYKIVGDKNYSDDKVKTRKKLREKIINILKFKSD